MPDPKGPGSCMVNVKGWMFVLIAKNATSSIKQRLCRNGFYSMLIQEVKDHSSYEKWAIVRNPFDRFISGIAELRFRAYISKIDMMFYDLKFDPRAQMHFALDHVDDIHIRKQVEFIKPLQPIDHIGIFEDIDKWWDKHWGKYGKLLKTNVREETEKLLLVNAVDEELAHKINEHYKEDWELYNETCRLYDFRQHVICKDT